MRPIYLDYQASTPLLSPVKEFMGKLLDGFMGNPHSETHIHGREASLIVEQARDQIADLISADPTNVIFTSGATESNNFAIKQAPMLNPNRKTILVGSTEHKCVLESANEMKKQGYTVIALKVDNKGNIDNEHFREMLSEDVALVSIMSANNEIGTITKLAPLIDAVHSIGGLFHTDAAQHVSNSNIDVNETYADFISFSSHKMYGPKGVGAIYIAPHLHERMEPLIHGGGQQDGKRSGTLSPLLCGGFGAAAKEYIENGNQIRSRTKDLRDQFYNQLTKNIGARVELVGPTISERHIGNLNIKFDKPCANLLGQIIPNLSASNGSACSSGEISSSHVLKSIGLTESEADSCVRFSFGFGLSDEEIHIACKILTSAFQT